MALRLALLVLVTASPPTAEAPADPLAAARRTFNEQGPLAGAEAAAAAFPSEELPRETRLRLALFGSNSYALTYQADPEDPPGDPNHLCKALALLAACEQLAETEDEREAHRRLVDTRRGDLAKNHPGHRCEHEQAPASEASATTEVPATETATPVEPGPPASAPPAPPPAGQPSPETLRLRRRAQVLTALGGTSLGLAVASFAVMGGALARQEGLRQRAEGYHDTTPGVLTSEQSRDVDADRLRYTRLDRVVVATAIVGSVMAITGMSMVVRGTLLKRRLQVAPDVNSDRAALVLSGRF